MAGKRRSPAPATNEATSWWARRRAARKARPTTWKTRVLGFLKWATITGVVLVLVAAVAFVILYKSINVPAPNAAFKTATTRVYYDGGKDELGTFAVQNRTPLSYAEMPQDIKDAVIAAENRTFFTDKGIDPKAILRAAFSNASGNSTQGASTITQQYVKILYLSQDRSYKRKIKEAILSLKIQREESKQEVLQGYLNAIYFGRGAYGIQAAAQAFFQVDAKNLNVRQAAVLASVLNNPTQFDPAGGKGHVKALKERYDYVLDNMAKDGDLTAEQAQKLGRRLPPFPKIPEQSAYGGQKGFMLTMVKDQLMTMKDDDGNPFTEDRIDGAGLSIETSFTKKAMDAAAAGVKAERPDGFSDKHLHIGVASVEPGTGAVRGFYGGQDFLQSQINWAIAGGQAGSTFKPFALATALKNGYSLRDTFDGNSPLTLADGTEVGNEQNHDYGSAVTLLYATEQSINTAYTDLTNSIPDGPAKIVATANDMGIPPLKAPKKGAFGFPTSTPGLLPDTTVALGPQTVSPINMANGYATIANGGVEADPFIISKVTNADGKVIYQHQVTTHRAISSDVAADVSYAMQQVVQNGTGTAALALGRPAAGKTGTATNGLDQVSSAWFAGFTPQLATAVMYVRGTGVQQLDGWLPSYFGADYPARTWTAVMQAAMDGVAVKDFPPAAFVDGTPPETGHTYVPPPAPVPVPVPAPATSQPTRRPPSSAPTSQAPTSEPPTSEPTSAPPTSAPPPLPTPTDCPLLTTCPTSPPPSSPPPPPSPPPSSPAPSPSPSPSAAAVARGGPRYP